MILIILSEQVLKNLDDNFVVRVSIIEDFLN